MKNTTLAMLVALLLVMTQSSLRAPTIGSPAQAAPTISFDTTPGGAGGTLTYDGVGGPLIGRNIVFVDVAGSGTPLHAGGALSCVGCQLSFTTGPNISEGAIYQWAGGGSFTLTGAIPGIPGLASNTTLLQGSFAGTPNLTTLGTTGIATAIGQDLKNTYLTTYFGLPNSAFMFANTEIALDTLTVGANGSLSAVPNQADIINTPVPEPMTLGLLGLGLLALGVSKKWRAVV